MKSIEPHIAAVKKNLKRIDLSRPRVPTASEREYFRYYGLDLPCAGHFFGTLRSRECTLAVHVFVPEKYRAAAVLVHGYLEHGGYFRHAVRKLLKEGCAVVLFDLPGHGLSSGSPATVRDFARYACALEHVVRFCARSLGSPVSLVGHSMGCSAVVELLLTRSPSCVDKVVLAAPLVHSGMWRATTAAYQLLSRYVKKVPRMFPALSHDTRFMRFTLFQDPLMRRKIPLSWVHAMLRWNERLERYPASPREIDIIQGTDDRIVDGKYNATFLKKKFPAARLYLIQDARHQLFNETARYRLKTMNAVVHCLAAGRRALRSGTLRESKR